MVQTTLRDRIQSIEDAISAGHIDAAMAAGRGRTISRRAARQAECRLSGGTIDGGGPLDIVGRRRRGCLRTCQSRLEDLTNSPSPVRQRKFSPRSASRISMHGYGCNPKNRCAPDGVNRRFGVSRYCWRTCCNCSSSAGERRDVLIAYTSSAAGKLR